MKKKFFITMSKKVCWSDTSVLRELLTKSIYFCASFTSSPPINHLFSDLKNVSGLATLFKSISETVRYGTVKKP